MQHALADAPRLQLDPKRIAATSGAIAVHVVVLMMLMMPAQAPAPVAVEEIIVPNWEKPRVLPPQPPPPQQPPRQPPQAAPPRQVVPIADPPVVNLDQEASAVDFLAPVVPELPPTSFDSGPPASVFQELATIAAPAPPYPRQAMARNVEGTVGLRIHVDAGGNPIEVSIERSSGSALLDQAALKQVKARWRFVPAQRDGQATDAWALVSIAFVLD